jgi:hypothetical protein
LLEALFELLFEVFGEALFAMAGAVVHAAVVEPIDDESPLQRALAAVGHVFMGAVAGAVSLVVLRRELGQHLVVPGISLLLAPIATGALLELLGRWWVRHGNVRMALLTFWGGFCFALGMAAVRFAFFERPWGWL